MKRQTTQKEILLVTGTSFGQRRLERPGGRQANINFKKGIRRIFDQTDWSMILPAILPEIVEEDDTAIISFIRKGNTFIQFEMSEEPLIIEREFSIDPCLFLSSQIDN